MPKIVVYFLCGVAFVGLSVLDGFFWLLEHVSGEHKKKAKPHE
jgi:hypothetical protein